MFSQLRHPGPVICREFLCLDPGHPAEIAGLCYCSLLDTHYYFIFDIHYYLILTICSVLHSPPPPLRGVLPPLEFVPLHRPSLEFREISSYNRDKKKLKFDLKEFAKLTKCMVMHLAGGGGIRYQVPDFTLVGGSFFLPKTQLVHGTNWWVYCPFSRKTVSTWY